MPDNSYQSKIYLRQGGDRLVEKDGAYGLTSVNAAVTAAGNSLATAKALTAESNVVAGADNTTGVSLPAAEIGMVIFIKNTVADKVLKVYGAASGVGINAITAGSAISMAASTGCWFFAVSATQWYTLPLLPS